MLRIADEPQKYGIADCPEDLPVDVRHLLKDLFLCLSKMAETEHDAYDAFAEAFVGA